MDFAGHKRTTDQHIAVITHWLEDRGRVARPFGVAVDYSNIRCARTASRSPATAASGSGAPSRWIAVIGRRSPGSRRRAGINGADIQDLMIESVEAGFASAWSTGCRRGSPTTDRPSPARSDWCRRPHPPKVRRATAWPRPSSRPSSVTTPGSIRSPVVLPFFFGPGFARETSSFELAPDLGPPGG